MKDATPKLTTAASVRRAIAKRQWSQKEFRAALAARGYTGAASTISKVLRGKLRPSDTLKAAIEDVLGFAFESWERAQ